MAIASFAVLALAVAGCGTKQADDSQAGGTQQPTPIGTTHPTIVPPAPTKPVPPASATVVVQGVIEQGVEPGCLVLTPDKGGPKYLLIAATPPPVGVPVTVHGVTKPDQVSYCQQGTPLQVSQVERR